MKLTTHLTSAAMTNDTKLILFRADKRVFKPSDGIATAGEFSSKHPEAGKLAEEIFDKTKPAGKPNRGDCLMLFEDEGKARRHWVKMTGGLLYRVEIDASSMLHRGNMDLVDKIGRLIANNARDEAGVLAERYWTEEPAGDACVEVLVPGGTVIEMIGTTRQGSKNSGGSISQRSIRPRRNTIPGWTI